MSKIREATKADCASIVHVHVKAAPEIPIVRYRYPGATEHEDAFGEIIGKKYEKELKTSRRGRGGRSFTVYEMPMSDGADEGSKRIVGFAVWQHYPAVRLRPTEGSKSSSNGETMTEGVGEEDVLGDCRTLCRQRRDKEDETWGRQEEAPNGGGSASAGNKPITDVVANEARLQACNVAFGTYLAAFRQGHADRDVLWLRMLCVLPDYRGKGFGAALVWEAVEDARQRSLREGREGGKALVVGLLASPRARHLYERIGFRDEGGFAVEVDGEGDADGAEEELSMMGMALITW